LALQGAQDRLATEHRGLITAAYLGAMLTHCDPAKAPKLDEIIGEADPASQTPDIDPNEDTRANARAWIAVVDGMNGSKPSEEEADA